MDIIYKFQKVFDTDLHPRLPNIMFSELESRSSYGLGNREPGNREWV